jgi:cyclophilin family peptidyl-prolyl cis-trans isomerase
MPGKIIGITVGVLAVLALLGLSQLAANKPNNQKLMNSGNTWGSKQATLVTNLGNIEIELLAGEAPQTVANFIKLAEDGFYDGTLIHRAIKNFMIQGGDPLTKNDPGNWTVHGTGGPGYTFADEPNNVRLERGVLAMANAGPNTNGSQFFIIVAPVTDWLQGKHTGFGRVTGGMEIVDQVSQVKTNQNDHPLEDVVLEKVIIK